MTSSLAGQRLEECSPGGCYMELCLQMAIIFVGKQFLLSFVEYQLPRLWKLYNSFKVCSTGTHVLSDTMTYFFKISML